MISSGDLSPFWFNSSKPKRFKNVSPELNLSLFGVEKLSTIWTSRLEASIFDVFRE